MREIGVPSHLTASLLWFVVACGDNNAQTGPMTPASGGTGGTGLAGSGGPGVSPSGGLGVPSGGAVNPSGGSGNPTTGGTSATSGSTGTPPVGGSTPGAGAPNAVGGGGTGGAPLPSAGTGGSAPVIPVEEPKLVISSEGKYWQVGTLTEATGATADVTVNDSSVLQPWKGFGGTFNEKGWTALAVLPDTERTRAIKLLFDANEGARFLYGRVPIGASDYANDRYTLNENAGDVEMTMFSIERDKQSLIPYIQAALAVNKDLHLWASPWTPPTWMKTGTFSNDPAHPEFNGMNGGNMKEDATNFQAFANYLAKFVQEYGKLGIKIEAIHPQNEPGYNTRYPSCLWTAAGMAQFIGSYLGPTFEKQGVTAEIFLGTMSKNDAGADPAIISAVTGDANAMKYVKGFGLQWNVMGQVAALKSRNLTIVQSEHKCGNYPFSVAGAPAFNADKPQNDYAYGVESWGYIRDWIKAGVNVYSAWNMVLDVYGHNLDFQRVWPQNALLVVDTAAKTLTATPAYYVFRHASQFVDPGAQVVGTSGGDALAFKNPDGSIVAVMYNSGAAKKFTVSIAGKNQQFDMPAKGFATVNWH